MFLEASVIETFTIIAVVGAVGGLVGGLLASADSLIGTILMGIIGGIALSAIFRVAGWPPVYSVGDDFSVVWALVGGAVLGFAVGRSNA